MKIFIYKTIFATLCLFILYQLTLGEKIDNYEHSLRNLTNDQGRELIRNKIRGELKKAIVKDQILKPEDREILKQFIAKIQNELSQ